MELRKVTLSDKLRLLTIVFGLIALALKADIYEPRGSDKEKTFFAFIIIAFIVSIFVAILAIFKLTASVGQWKQIDAGIHALLGGLLAIGWILDVIYVSDVDEIWRKTGFKRPSFYNRWLTKASFVLIFEAINIPLYLIIAFLIFRGR